MASLFAALASPITQTLEALLARRRPKKATSAGSPVAVAGAYLILEPYIAVRSCLGSLLAILATPSWAAYAVLVRRSYPLYRPVEAMAWISLLGLTAMLSLAPVSRLDALTDLSTLLLLACIAAAPGALAYRSWNMAV